MIGRGADRCLSCRMRICYGLVFLVMSACGMSGPMVEPSAVYDMRPGPPLFVSYDMGATLGCGDRLVYRQSCDAIVDEVGGVVRFSPFAEVVAPESPADFDTINILCEKETQLIVTVGCYAHIPPGLWTVDAPGLSLSVDTRGEAGR